jgi:hypothetical protein
MSEEFNVQAEPELPEILYHYTTPKGLLGILSEKKLRLSHFEFLNDGNEFKTGYHSFIEEAKTFFENNNKSAEFSKYKKILDETIADHSKNYPPYLACFSTKQNDLTQWRAYSQLGGYALGLNTSVLKNCFDSKKYHLLPVEYNNNYFQSHKDLIKDAYDGFFGIQQIFDRLKQERQLDSINDRENFIKQVSQIPAYKEFRNMIIRPTGFFIIIKDEAFKAESEWRAIRAPEEEHFKFELLFDVKASFIKPYIEVELPNIRALISKIWIGPMDKQELAKKGLEIFLEKNGLDPGIIECSEIPYREF